MNEQTKELKSLRKKLHWEKQENECLGLAGPLALWGWTCETCPREGLAQSIVSCGGESAVSAVESLMVSRVGSTSLGSIFGPVSSDAATRSVLAVYRSSIPRSVILLRTEPMRAAGLVDQRAASHGEDCSNGTDKGVGLVDYANDGRVAFEGEDGEHMVTLTHSLLSGKKVISVDGREVYRSSEVRSSFPWKELFVGNIPCCDRWVVPTPWVCGPREGTVFCFARDSGRWGNGNTRSNWKDISSHLLSHPLRTMVRV